MFVLTGPVGQNRPHMVLVVSCLYNSISGETLITFIFLSYFRYVQFPTPRPDGAGVVERVVYALRWQTLSILAVFWGVHTVGWRRFSSTAIDPMSPDGDLTGTVGAKYLQNTLEQYLLHLLAQLILATFIEGAQIKIIPILVLLFVAGRMAFWFGYNHNPMHRGFGYGLTLFPTSATLLYCLFSLFVKGPGHGMQ